MKLLYASVNVDENALLWRLLDTSGATHSDWFTTEVMMMMMMMMI